MKIGLILGVATPLLLLLLLLSPTALMAQAERGLEEARRAVEETASHQTSVLRELMGQVPNEARGGLERAIAASEAERTKALADLGKAERGVVPADQGIATAYEAVNKGTQRHLDELNGLLNKVPEQAKPAIQRALEVSRTGRETALARLRAVREGRAVDGPGSEAIGRPGISERPEASSRPGFRPGPPSGFGRPGGFPAGGGRPGGVGR